MTRSKTYDYIIVGAGSAGCTLASRLAENEDTRVLLLEAGGWDNDPWLGIPIAWGRNVARRRHDWMYSSEPDAHLNNRKIPMNRGKVIGGSSSINAMAYVRGHRSDYDRWAKSGLSQWSYRHALPYFRRQETWAHGPDRYRGSEGPLHTCRPPYPDPLTDAFLEAGAAAGHPYTEDYNGAEQRGFSRGQSTIRAGRRSSASTAYLHPVLDRPNLEVKVNSHVLSLIIKEGRAAGLRYRRNERDHMVWAEQEILLAAGSLNSPQILMLSGIGDPEELKKFDIPVQVSLPGVGRNLQDHIAAGVDHGRQAPGPLVERLRLDRILVDLGRAHFFGTGFATCMPNNVMAFLCTLDCRDSIPDIQLLFRAAPLGARPYLPPFTSCFVDGFGCRPVLLRPDSRGRVSLGSADPLKPIRIHSDFLTTDKDVRTLTAGVQMAREIFQTPPTRRYSAGENFPGPDVKSQADLAKFVRGTAETIFHPIGTCKMGLDEDPFAVVDPQLYVRGIAGLRVVDASVMPDLVGGNINAAVTMIAEKAADMIRNRPPAVDEAA